MVSWKQSVAAHKVSYSSCFYTEKSDSCFRPQNFDNVPNAMMTLFEMGTTEGWVGIMYSTVDATGIDMQPQRDYSPYWVVLCMVFIVVGAYFVVNLFVGVIIDNFERLKEENEGASVMLTTAQQRWLETRKTMMRLRPALSMKPPENSIRRALYNIVQVKNIIKTYGFC